MLVVYIILLGYIGLTMYLANQTEAARQAMLARRRREGTPEDAPLYDSDYREQASAIRGLLYGGVFLIAMFAPFILYIGFIANTMDPAEAEAAGLIVPDVGWGATIFGVLIALGGAAAAYAATTSQDVRRLLARLIGDRGRYDTGSPVHTTGVVLSLLLLIGQIIQFLAIGGPEGLAQSIEQGGVDPTSLFFQMALQVAAAFLGVGWAIRRNTEQSLGRLGLRLPTADDLRWGIGGGLLLMVALFAFNIVVNVITLIVDPDAFEASARASQVLTEALSTLPLALIVATTAAIGEELLFRGALQPIFGNVLVSIFFALLHTQSLLSPGLIFLFLVSYGLGWLRERHSTTTAIIAHFVYNFVQLLLAILIAQSGAA
ncbi:MAG: CPBP family intramembrane glutamic endopeptidase [Chloroflexota bacterium]